MDQLVIELASSPTIDLAGTPGYSATLRGQAAVGLGESEAEAIGNLVLKCPDLFGVRVQGSP